MWTTAPKEEEEPKPEIILWPSKSQVEDKKGVKDIQELRDYPPSSDEEGEVDWLNVGAKKVEKAPVSMIIDEDERPIKPSKQPPS